MEDDWIIVKKIDACHFFMDFVKQNKLAVLQIALYTLTLDWKLIFFMRAILFYKKYKRYIWNIKLNFFSDIQWHFIPFNSNK